MKKIKIIKNGPYLVSGSIPLSEQIIVPGENGNIYKPGRTFEVGEGYALCRCGKSKNMPFCDGTHQHVNFNGMLTASKEPFSRQAKRYYGKNLMLEDVENLCAFARFCHTKDSDAWTLVETAANKSEEDLAIKVVCDCPSGRLVVRDMDTNTQIEPSFDPSIVLLQDPSRECSGPLWIRGGILIEDENGEVYEKRNRVTLCRCGKSENKPFCDATHVDIKYSDH